MQNKHSQYYEAIIQLRNPNEELLNFINNQLKKRKDIFISKEIKQKKGVDLYISSQRFARALGNKMKKSFHGSLKTSRELHTRNRQTSKNVYRVTVLFRLE
jgi:nonsense-mediated mRNA decay protein 3